MAYGFISESHERNDNSHQELTGWVERLCTTLHAWSMTSFVLRVACFFAERERHTFDRRQGQQKFYTEPIIWYRTRHRSFESVVINLVMWSPKCIYWAVVGRWSTRCARLWPKSGLSMCMYKDTIWEKQFLHNAILVLETNPPSWNLRRVILRIFCYK